MIRQRSIIVSSLFTAIAISAAAPAGPDQPAGPSFAELHASLSHAVGVYADDAHVLRLASMPCDDEACLYVEMVESGQERTPIRQQVWSFRPDPAGGASVVVYDFPARKLERFMPSLADVAVGLWAAPERFPKINLDDLVPLGVARASFAADHELTLTTPTVMRIHRDQARSISLTVKTGESLLWVEEVRDAQGRSIDTQNLTLGRTDETTPITITPEGLVIIDLRLGKGVELAAGDGALIDYAIFRGNGQLVDSTRMPDRHAALLRPAPGDYFLGFKQGVLGMRASQKAGPPGQAHLRKLIVPAVLAFGSKGRGPIIGPDEPLIVDIELLTLRDNTKD